MQVDNPLSQQFTFNQTPNFDDFFNMDLLGAGGSRSDSRSPSSSFTTLPSPTAQPYGFPGTDMDTFFNFALDEETTKVDTLAPPPSSTPYDFLGAFASLTSAGSSSASESSPGSAHPQSSESPDQLAIDPQLVGTPATSKAQSEFGDDEENDDDDDGGDEENMDMLPVKVGGKGVGRKGTVQSGGVSKKSGGSLKDNKDKKSNMDSDDWRPSAEEYKKMSSKEKRQLRNKISARNFRVRRKEYITTLEGDVAERDKLLDVIRSELNSTQSENASLRQEISALKRALLEGRACGEPSPLPPPAPLPAVSAATTVAQRASSPFLAPNIQKDIPLSPRLASKAFWGGSQTFGGITPVHTTIVPEFPLASALLRRPVSGEKPSSPPLQENINPALNSAPTMQNAQMKPLIHGFDSFADTNPFTMKTLDAYRMQLWGRMAEQQHAAAPNQHSSQHKSQQSGLTGLASNLRPHYFSATGTKQPLSTVSNNTSLSGKSSSPPSSAANSRRKDGPTPQQALLAAVASQTVLQRLGSAFWEAFSPSSSSDKFLPSHSRATNSTWDAEKVRRVLEGTAVVRVVDVDQSPVKKEESSPRLPVCPPRPQAAPASTQHEKCCGFSMSILEESVKSLSLGRK